MKLSKENRKKMMLKDLILSNIPISLDIFSQKYHLKSRMIRYIMDEIKEDLLEYDVSLVYKSKSGYYLHKNQKHLIPKELISIDETVYTDQELNEELFFELVLADSEISAEYLAQKYYSSTSSITRNLQKLDFCEHEGLTVESVKFKGFKLHGTTKTLVQESIARLLKQTKDHYLLEEMYKLLPQVIQEQFSYEAAKALDVALKKQNSKYDIWIDPIHYKELYFLWLVTMVMPILECESSNEAMNDDEYEYVEAILASLDQHWSNKRIRSFVDCLRSKSIALNKSKHTEQLVSVVERMIVKHVPTSEYDVVTLKNDLIPHLSLTLSKYEQGVVEDNNPLSEQILMKYPKEKEKASAMLRLFTESFNLPYSSNDVSYLIMYLYKNRKNNSYRKLRVAVVCATGRGFSNMMEARLSNRFKNIDIVKSVSAFHHESFHADEIDLLISTIPIDVEDIPLVLVSPILSHDDLEKIQRFCDQSEYQQPEVATQAYHPIKQPIQSVGNYANQLSRITVYLLDSLTEYMDEYEISQENLFGLVIHMMMAIERWENEEDEQFEDATLIYQQIASDHPKLFHTMETFFLEVEQLFNCRINLSERIAFFHYLT